MANASRRGRKAGTPNKVTAATRARIEELADPIGFLASVANGDEMDVGDGESTAVKRARPTLDQRINAARWLADRLLPQAKSAPITVDLPKSGGVVEGMNSVIEKVAAGSLPPDEGKLMVDLLEAKRRAIETDDLERRIAALETAKGTA